jgi:predicted DNA-binding antitoxin AbrB/MazE fold protein
LPSLDYPVRSRQHTRRNRQADLLRRLEVDHKFKLRRLLDRKITGFGTLRILSLIRTMFSPLRLTEPLGRGYNLPMRIQKREPPIEQTFQAVFEKGVLRPLEPLHLKEKSLVTVSLCGESRWRNEFERLMRKMSRRTRSVAQKEIETEITQARADVKATRRAARRSA